MGRDKNIEIINNIINEVGQYIIGTVGQHSVEWDYACFLSLKKQPETRVEFLLFNNKKIVDFKSSQLNFVLNMLFEEYKKNLNLNPETAIKYIIRNSDLKADVQVDKDNSWSDGLIGVPKITYDLAIEKTVFTP